MTGIGLWIGFGVFVAVMLAIDLGLINRKAHVISVKEAARWTAVVVTAAALFNLWVFLARGQDAGLEFLTGYVIELALSVDNIFVFILIFTYFKVPRQYQHRVLFWGILGALVLRGAMIAAGWLLLERFHWITWVFGVFLILTGVRSAFQQEVDLEPDANPALRLIRRVMRVRSEYDGQRFFTRETVDGRARLVATPLFVVLVIVETTDLIFAVDSIPAVFAITMDPFIVFTSNVFAILGLRSMYFLLAGSVDKFHFLKLGLSALLTFIGTKMVATFFGVHVPISISLSVIAIILAVAIGASLAFPRAAQSAHPGDAD